MLESGDAQRGELALGRRWTFGQVVLDERSLELTVGGEPARLERKPLEVLLYLLRRAGEVVTKEELAENLWPGRILTETVLTRCISQLRQVLRDDDRNLIRTVHGFGYRLVAAVRVDAVAPATVPALSFKPGDHPPQRPQWQLAERLGTGGHGEAWLARHDKTGDARVFKFARDAEALGSLKREITLYRLLHDSLGERAAVVSLFEWNLEEPPYFLETEYVRNRDLRAWADARGGLAGVPLEHRLELVAQVAEALGAAHSVGVLHKDLKPGNVLVAEDSAGAPRIRLSDFGSGGVLDVARLDALGITNLGFTQTGQDTGATPLYLAPEIVAGQPFTVGADIYALGVMLYQLIVADLRRPLAPGWELNVEDPLLREDIAATAAGDPLRRLTDAGQLATRLRSLDERRRARVAEAAARERAERTQRIMEELRRTRAFAAAVLVLAVAAVVGGMLAYRARNDAIAARSMTQAINDFLTDGVLGVDPAAEKPKDASYESLLNRAASQVDMRFGEQPEAAASIHWLLGRRFQEVGHVEEARIQYENAARQLAALQGREALPALLSLDRLIPIYVERGHLSEAVTLSEKLAAEWGQQYGQLDLSTLLLRTRIARLSAQLGDLTRADAEFKGVLVEITRAPPATDETKLVLKEFLGWTLAADTSALATPEAVAEAANAYIKSMYAGYLGDFAEDYSQSAAKYREALPTLSKLLGSESEVTAATRLSLGMILAYMGQFEEANDHLQLAKDFYDTALPTKHWLRVLPQLFIGRMKIEQQEAAAAIDLLNAAMSLCVQGKCAPRLAEEIRYDLARAYDQAGQIDRAIDGYRQSLDAYELLRGPNHVGTLRRRLSLADSLRRAGKLAESAFTVNLTRQEALEALPRPHMVVADYNRIQGLLLLERHPQRAHDLLQESLKIFELRLGKGHPRTMRVRAELDNVF